MDPSSELTEKIAMEGIQRGPENTGGLGCEHVGGLQAAMRDGSARFISTALEPSALQSLLNGTAKESPEY
jgi:hypothetical protein